MDKDEMSKAMAAMLLGKMGGGDGPQCVTGQERERVYEEMQHLDLAPGDKVRWISEEYCDAKFPRPGEVAEVFRVFPIVTRDHQGGNHDAAEDDFSVLTKHDGTYYEYCFDSRRFELVK
jgi:plastocyanin